MPVISVLNSGVTSGQQAFPRVHGTFRTGSANISRSDLLLLTGSNTSSHKGNKVQGRKVHSVALRPMAASNSAYIDAGLAIDGASSGPLSGLTFAAKDMYDIKGLVTGFGNPIWKATHPSATETAPALKALLDAGADLRGRTHMDELAYSLNGENMHYGTPTNPAAPDRVPGGSSSGSAVATAAGDVDFAVGSDTGGSVRVPASYCGILGMRPSHGRASLEGACPLGPSFDTCGWFARDTSVLRKVGGVLLQPSGSTATKFSRLLVGKDAFDLCEAPTRAAIYEAFEPKKGEIEQLLGKLAEVDIAGASSVGTLHDWFNVFRIVQAAEAWEALGPWILEAKPEFGPGIKERFDGASKITEKEAAENVVKREEVAAHMDKLLGGDAVLMVPAAPGPAPKPNVPTADLNNFRTKLVALTSIAGLGRLPQITIPVGKVDGCPIAIGIIGPRGSDEALLEVAEKLYPLLQ